MKLLKDGELELTEFNEIGYYEQLFEKLVENYYLNELERQILGDLQYDIFTRYSECYYDNDSEQQALEEFNEQGSNSWLETFCTEKGVKDLISQLRPFAKIQEEYYVPQGKTLEDIEDELTTEAGFSYDFYYYFK